MKIANLFDERIEVEAGSRATEDEIERRYGIPADLQILQGPAERPFLRLRTTTASGCTAKQMPAEVAELGCSQERFDRYYNVYGDLAVQRLFPFISTSMERPRSYLGHINKNGLENTEEYIGRIKEGERHAIVNNVEAYIDAFLSTPLHGARRQYRGS